MTDFSVKMKYYKDITEKELNTPFLHETAKESKITEAAIYSLSAGGKRIRPVLCLAFTEMFEGPINDALQFACAIEMIHTFSLIHDDLPGMDNDDFRRGKLTCHKVYGEGMAILAGDALLNGAYDRIFRGSFVSASQDKILAALRVLSDATGVNGMIGGQAIDIGLEHDLPGISELSEMYSMKTGALIKAPVEIACILSDVSDDIASSANEFAQATGLAFQIKDDILDVESTKEVLGKTTGKDAAAGKNTYASILGSQGAKEHLSANTAKAFAALQKISDAGYDTEFMTELTRYLLLRDH